MALEIERKFVVSSFPETMAEKSVIMTQGYISRDKGRVVRVRIAGKTAWLTLKGPKTGFTCHEYEYTVPTADAAEMLRVFCTRVIEKERFFFQYRGNEWVVDRFSGENSGLILAEIELNSENQPFDLPDWVGTEVTGNPRYYNASLVDHPFTAWDTV